MRVVLDEVGLHVVFPEKWVPVSTMAVFHLEIPVQALKRLLCDMYSPAMWSKKYISSGMQAQKREKTGEELKPLLNGEL